MIRHVAVNGRRLWRVSLQSLLPFHFTFSGGIPFYCPLCHPYTLLLEVSDDSLLYSLGLNFHRLEPRCADWWRWICNASGSLSKFELHWLTVLIFSVYRASNPEHNPPSAACKLVLLREDSTTKQRELIMKEMKIQKALKGHRNVIGYYAFGVVEWDARKHFVPGFYIYLELAAGGDLFDKIGTYALWFSFFRWI